MRVAARLVDLGRERAPGLIRFTMQFHTETRG